MLQRFQQAEIDDAWTPYDNIIFSPFSVALGPFDNAGPFMASPGPFLGTAPNSAIGPGYSGLPSPADTSYRAVPAPVCSPVHVPALISHPSLNVSPVPSRTESPVSSREDSIQAQKPRASIRNRYTDHEIDVIMQMKAQGHGNDKIAQVRMFQV